jgi:REP element-mobilizing transposase RayT
VFDDPDWATRAVESLLLTAAAIGFDIDAYCVMPDHVHFLAEARAQEQADLRTLAHRFKQKLGFEFKQASGRTLWQRSYYEHVLRPEESLVPYVAYVLGNPVRAGLAETVDRWPHSGPPEVLARSGDADRSEDLSLQMKALIAGIEHEMDSTEHGPTAPAASPHKDHHHA